MKQINIAKTLAQRRREKGITQDDLAEYIGVSKASVSKWETGQSYPDITFLPLLATYFNITIDELIGYEPQMEKKDIRKLYIRLSIDFANKPFYEVLAECHEIIKKYYSCFPLLMQIAILLVNHHMLAKETEEGFAILKDAIKLLVKIKNESNDIWLSKDATALEATAYLIMNQPQEVLLLLGESIRPISNDHELIGVAYKLLGNTKKAREVTQIVIYQHLVTLVCLTSSYLTLYEDQPEKTKEILNRTFAIIDAYNMVQLHPNSVLQIYHASAHVYCVQNNIEKAIDMLQKYTELCISFFPCNLHGDSFFDKIESWFQELDLGTEPVRNEKLIKESMLVNIIQNPTFQMLKEHKRYQNLVNKLTKFINESQ